MTKIAYFIVFLIAASLRGYADGCPVSEEDLENSFLEVMFFGSEKSIVPSNDAEMKQHCDLIHHGIDGIKKFGMECTKGFPQNVIKLLLKSMKDHMEKRCDNAKDKAEFIEYVGCLLPKDQKMGPFNLCSEKHTKMLELAVEMGDKGHIHGSCCAYYFFRHCVLDQIEHTCSQGHRQFWEEIFDDVATEVTAFACEGFNSVDKCTKDFNPEFFKQLDAIDKATDPSVWAHGHKTPMRPLLDMIAKYHSSR